MNKLIAAAAVGLGIVGLTGSASANGCTSPFCGGGGQKEGLCSYLFAQRPVPAFQAAPWYLYFPYNAHFQTPGPINAPFYAPPTGGAMVNPYFPAMPAYVPAR